MKPAYVHDRNFIPCCSSLCKTSQHEAHTFYACTLLSIWGLSSVSVTQYRRPRPLVALTGSGLTQKDRLSHAAGDAPLACRLSLYLSGVLWMQADKRLQRRCPFLPLTPDVRVQEHYSCSGQFILCVGITLHCDLLY